jgi:3-dehydroquinate dehydratase
MEYKWSIRYNSTTEESTGSFSQFSKRIKEICSNPNVFNTEIHISEVRKTTADKEVSTIAEVAEIIATTDFCGDIFCREDRKIYNVLE